MPTSHQKYASRSPEDMEAWAGQLGADARDWTHRVFERCKHPEQGYRTVLGVIQLAKKYTPERVNNACKRANTCGAYSYRSVKSILDKGLDHIPLDHPKQPPIPEHDNVRGAQYYTVKGGDSEWAFNKH
jgi:hypothetical protein